MHFVRLLLSGVAAEFRAIFGVVPLLLGPFWIAWGLCFLPALVGLLPGRWAVIAQLFVLVALGLAGLFSGALAKRVRRRQWVEFPDGPEVVPYLPQLITLLMGPAYFLAMLVLFGRVAEVFPGMLPTAGWLDALLLSFDNFIRTQVFFDAAECFHLRLDGQVEGTAGASLVFVSRFLMDLVFIKLAVQLCNAAYFRARGLGRGEDLLFTVKQEIDAGDVPRVKDLCQQVGDSLRDAVDTLRRYWEGEAREGEAREGEAPAEPVPSAARQEPWATPRPPITERQQMACRCLVTMKDYALPYLKARHRSATGDERERIAKLIDRLESAPAEDGFSAELAQQAPLSPVLGGEGPGVRGPNPEKSCPTAPSPQPLSPGVPGARGFPDRLPAPAASLLSPPLIALAAGLILGVALSFLLTGVAALVVALPLTALTSWMLAGSRGWIDRLVRWRALAPSTPDRLPRLQLRWALCLLPLLIVAWSRLFQLVAGPAPAVFTGASAGEVNFPSTLVFVLENLLHTQIFVDTFEVYGVRIADLRQEGFLGGLLTFLLRLTLNVGIIELLVAFGLVWYNRLRHGFAVTPNAELSLRKEAAECGPQAAGIVGYHLTEVRGFLVEQMKKQKDRGMLVALAASGFFKNVQAARDGNEKSNEPAAARHHNLGMALSDQGRLEDAVVEYQAARKICEQLVSAGRHDLRNQLAATRMSLGNALGELRRLDEAITELQAAREIREHLADEDRDHYGEDLARTQMSLGNAFRLQGRLKEAVAEHQAAREIYERLVREGRNDLRNELAAAQMNLGTAFSDQGLLDEAVAEFQAARDIRERLVEQDREDCREDLARTRMNLAVTLSSQGRLEEAVVEYQAATQTYERLVREGRDHLRTEVAMTRMNLGLTLGKQGRFEKAVVEYQAATQIYERLVREGRDDLRDQLAEMRMGLGYPLAKLGRLEEALAEYHAAREIYERLVQQGRDTLRKDLAGTRMNIGNALRIQGRLQEAVAEIHGAREIYERLVREGQLRLTTDLAMCWYNGLLAAKKISEQEATGLVRPACSLLQDLVPYRAKLSPGAFVEISDFLRLAHESNISIEDVAALAAQFAPREQ